MKRWYALYTMPNSEYRVAAALQEQGIDTYLPEISSSKDGKEFTRTPFFSCYLFMRVNLETVGYAKWQWTPGLRHIVAFGNEPVPLPDEAISLIRHKLDEIEAAGGAPAHPFRPGDTVRITEGPLRDTLAIFDGPTTPSQRVQVLLAFLGSISRVKIDAANLKKAPAGAQVPMLKRPRRTRGRGRRISGTPRQVS